MKLIKIFITKNVNGTLRTIRRSDHCRRSHCAAVDLVIAGLGVAVREVLLVGALLVRRSVCC